MMLALNRDTIFCVATRSSWNVTVGDDRLPRQSLIYIDPYSNLFLRVTCRDKSNHCRNPPAAAAKDGWMAKYALFHEQGK
jgi:hypothetical protein